MRLTGHFWRQRWGRTTSWWIHILLMDWALTTRKYTTPSPNHAYLSIQLFILHTCFLICYIHACCEHAKIAKIERHANLTCPFLWVQDVVSPTMPCRWMASCCGMPPHQLSDSNHFFHFSGNLCNFSAMKTFTTHVQFDLHLHFHFHVLILSFLFHLHSSSPLFGVDDHVGATSVGLVYRWIHSINIQYQ